VNLEGALTWAFEFEDRPYFAGFRALATNGIDKPVLNVFRMFAKMQGERLAVESDGSVSLDAMMRHGVRERPDVSGFASHDGKTLYVMLWHYHDDDLPGPTANVRLSLSKLSVATGTATIEHFAIDVDHSNAYSAWQRMGSPQHPTPAQYAQLERAGQLALGEPIGPVPIQAGVADVRLAIPRQAVSMLVVHVDRSGE
jgi:xylan 1,4-beta-xylosidase